MVDAVSNFFAGFINWGTAVNGAVIQPGNPALVNLDTHGGATGQAISSTHFTVGAMPPNSTNGTWDRVEFVVNYEHRNTTNAGDPEGQGLVSFWLQDTAGNNIQRYIMEITPDNRIGIFNGEATITFTDIAPGTYRLFAGEPNTSDGETMAIAVHNGTSYEALLCFAAGAMIETDRGQVAVEDLRTGDLVQTRDNGLQPVRWIGSRKLTAAELATKPNLRPIRIRAGALGKDLPNADLTVSPQHRVLVRSKIAQRMFDTAEVLVSAKHLLAVDGIEIAEDITEVDYFHILFDRHEVIISNGAETESLYTGEQALRSVSPAAREEIFTLFPELWNTGPTATRPAARLLLRGRPGRQLAGRHSKNGCDLVSEPTL